MSPGSIVLPTLSCGQGFAFSRGWIHRPFVLVCSVWTDLQLGDIVCLFWGSHWSSYPPLASIREYHKGSCVPPVDFHPLAHPLVEWRGAINYVYSARATIMMSRHKKQPGAFTFSTGMEDTVPFALAAQLSQLRHGSVYLGLTSRLQRGGLRGCSQLGTLGPLKCCSSFARPGDTKGIAEEYMRDRATWGMTLWYSPM
jgi:hypothetical protein